MIQAVTFSNFRVLRDARLPLGGFTLLVGPNGSGKSTAMLGLEAAARSGNFGFDRLVTHGERGPVVVMVHWVQHPAVWRVTWRPGRAGEPDRFLSEPGAPPLDETLWNEALLELRGFRIYALDAAAIAAAVSVEPNIELRSNGAALAAVLDRLRDEAPDRFEALADEFSACIPEFDRILFETPSSGHKALALRTRRGHHRISGSDLSQGTLLALALLTLAHIPNPPPFICLEEPDRGIHPRLLRDLRDAMYRLAYPDQFGEERHPTQVVATTHSPYLLDLYREHPEEIVIAHRDPDGAHFERLSDRSELAEILRETHLGDAWYSGVLGGVPSGE